MAAPKYGWNNLDNEGQRTFARNCVQRRASFETWTRFREIAEAKDILLVADRPGPKAPQTDAFHHTPFYSKIHSGGFLNAELVKAGISEVRLFWTNMATWDNKPGDTDILTARPWKYVIALGGNAAKFLDKNGVAYTRFDHPQYHKRFVGGEYPLIPFLTSILSSTQVE